MLGTLPNHSRGFDANTRVGPAMARMFYDAGYRFAMRYVKRATAHDYDLSVQEVVDLLRAGLAVGVVQHVAPPGWVPSGPLGSGYGRIAAGEAHLVGIPRGVTLWCDLEGVAQGMAPGEVIAFCNRWWEAVESGGYEAGLYVGDSCGLTADQLYRNLKFARYWMAYNADADMVPSVRGACMQQRSARVVDRVHGCPFEFDVNAVQTDHLGGTPTFLLP